MLLSNSHELAIRRTDNMFILTFSIKSRAIMVNTCYFVITYVIIFG